MNHPDLDPEKEQKRLDDLGRRIERSRAEIDAEDPATNHEERFIDTGREEGEDGEDGDEDEAIAPG